MAQQLTFDPGADYRVPHTASRVANPSRSVKRDKLEAKYEKDIEVNPLLDRTLVSYQANKRLPVYRWFKYKEGFSASLVKQVISSLAPKPGHLLDPFAGSGAALFAARELGWKTTGIELLPPGTFAIRARLAAERVNLDELKEAINYFASSKWVRATRGKEAYQHLRITRGAFSSDTEQQLNAFLSGIAAADLEPGTKLLLRFACFCILEDISYTRKDGQYLRWDHRSGRSLGNKLFNKGTIAPFREKLSEQLVEILTDVAGPTGTLFQLRSRTRRKAGRPPIKIIEKSCLDVLPRMDARQYDFIFTSPPYCNRYDYTRTYALELAFLGCDEEKVKNLRQAMMTCTVENKAKAEALRLQYKRFGRTRFFNQVMEAFEHQASLQEVLSFLDDLRDREELNNPGIARLVRNYFLELNLIVHECARVLKKGGYFVMVNDNVRYAGEAVPVDLILSELAKHAGLTTRHIWILGRGKGNSSQQMGIHGRTELRKCICVWEKS